MRHVVMFSGGTGSWFAARRVAARHGSHNVTLLFADTKMEDEDLYRFLDEAAADVGGQLVKVAEGRTPWEVFFDKRFLGNSRIDPCSRILKRELLRQWLDDHCDPTDTVVHLGIDWTEEHRFLRAQRYWSPWRCEAPLCQEPFILKSHMHEALVQAGITPPRLYALGFAHNNCGGFCIKAGKAHFKLLLKTMPDRFRYHEEQEQKLREHLNKDVAILIDRTKGQKRPLTLRELREKVEAEQLDDENEWGGCGCFSPAEEEMPQ